MTFADADRRYAELKQQFAAGALTVDQFDDQLHELMVQDNIGRWWAKSRESGEWHYYDPVTDAWVQALPPADKPAPPPPRPPEPQPKQQKPAKQDKHTAKAPPAAPPQAEPPAPTRQSPSAQSSAQSPAPGSAQPAAGKDALPKWAAVAPGAEPVANPGPARLEPLAANPATPLAELPDTSIPAPGASSRIRDFGPLPELSSSLKMVLYLVSLFVPFAGILLFFVYRNKPAQADRAAARAFLILGVLSFVFICLCSGTFWLFEGMMLGTKPT